MSTSTTTTTTSNNAEAAKKKSQQGQAAAQHANATSNAFDRLMKSAQAPGAFDLYVDYYGPVKEEDQDYWCIKKA